MPVSRKKGKVYVGDRSLGFQKPWASLASKYETLLRDKKDVDSVIQTDYWAYRKALKLIEERDREKRDQSVRVGEGTMQ